MNADQFLQNNASVQTGITMSAADSNRKVENLYRFDTVAKFKPQSVIISKRFYSDREKPTQTNANSLMNLEKGTAGQWNGYMSPATRRRVRGIIENYLTALQLNTSMTFPRDKAFPSSEVYPTFLTLTLPAVQHHCDNEIKEKCFLRFVEYLVGDREKGASGWGVKNYIWCAETQKNGNIHFHLIIDRAIPATRVNQVWNKFIDRLGYVDRFRNTQQYIFERGFYPRKDQLDSYIENKRQEARKTSQKFSLKETRKAGIKLLKERYERGVASNWSNPPSTNILPIQNVKKLTAYITKYMTKSPEIVSVPLDAGQRLLEENGKFFIETTSVERSLAYEIKDTGKVIVEAKEIQGETVSTDRQEIKVKFHNRRLRGRIWGCSKALHSEIVSPWTIAVESVSINQITTYQTVTRTVKSANRVTDLFGNERIAGMITRTETVELPKYERKTESPALDHDALLYLNFLENKLVGKKEVERATAMAGEMFAAYGGKIIPLEHPQKDTLQAYMPQLYDRYCEHYRSMFYALYPEQAPAAYAV